MKIHLINLDREADRLRQFQRRNLHICLLQQLELGDAHPPKMRRLWVMGHFFMPAGNHCCSGTIPLSCASCRHVGLRALEERSADRGESRTSRHNFQSLQVIGSATRLRRFQAISFSGI